MRIRVDALEARRVADEVGQDKVRRGSTTDPSSWCSGCRRSPPSARGCSASWTTPRSSSHPPSARSWSPGSARSTARPLRRRPARCGPRCPVDEEAPAERARAPPGRETSRRLRRLLAVVGWLAQVGESPIAEAARRFGMSEKELVAELELAACCGMPPYTPDTLMEIEVSETLRPGLPAGRVRAAPPPHAGRGVRRRRVGAAAPGRPGVGRRRTAPCPGQARRRTRVPGGGRGSTSTRRRHLAAVRERGRGGSGARDRLSLRLPRRAHDARSWSPCRCHDRRPLVSRRLLPPSRGHAALPGRPHRRGAPARAPAPGRSRHRPGRWRRCSCPGPGAVEVHLQLGPARSGCPSRCPCGRFGAARTDR